MHKYTSKIVIRKDGIRKDGTSPLLLQVFINRKRKRIRLGIYAPFESFSNLKQKIMGKGDHIDQLNAVIHKTKAEVNQIFTKATLDNEQLTVDRFLYYYQNQDAQDNFLAWMISQIDHMESNSLRAPGTIRNYRKVTNRISGLDKEITFGGVNHDFVEQFISSMKKEKKSPNTISAMNKILLMFINRAISKGRRIDNPYKNIKIGWAKTERVFLTINELQMMVDLYKSNDLNPELHRVLKYFLFMCFT